MITHTARHLLAAVGLSLAGLGFGVLAAGCTVAAPSAATSDIAHDIPFRPGERLTYGIWGIDPDPIGYGTLSVEADGDALVLKQAYRTAEEPASAARDITSVRVQRSTLRPLSGTRSVQGEKPTSFEWTYRADGDHASVTAVEVQGDRRTERTVSLRDHFYDNESSLWLWRSIVFAEGYDEHYVSVNPIERTQQTVNLRVPQRESITVPAGTFETWRILLRNGRAVRTAWINVQAPHQVVQWDNGDVILRLMPE